MRKPAKSSCDLTGPQDHTTGHEGTIKSAATLVATPAEIHQKSISEQSDEDTSTGGNAKNVLYVCPCGCGRKMDPATGLFFPIRAFPMGYKAHTNKKR
jgi:hypothetical protein